MPSPREIRRRIRSTKNVSQITRAMEMVSASKMRRAQNNVLATRPYAERLLDVMGELTARMVSQTARKGTLLEERSTINNIAIVIITPDRGLCGSLITNLLRRTSQFMLKQQEQGRGIQLYTIGKKGRDYMLRTRQNVIAEVTGLGDNPKLVDILGISTNVLNHFRDEQHDEVYLAYSKFVNTLVQQPEIKRVLPIEAPDEPEAKKIDYTYEPGQEEVLNEVLPRFAESVFYQAVLESIASEHSARMVAMRNATNNAKDLIRDLTLTYNKERQTIITKEVSEIASGATAMEASYKR
jgi:F-type H+-transporting ATPase subunit gamma